MQNVAINEGVGVGEWGGGGGEGRMSGDDS